LVTGAPAGSRLIGCNPINEGAIIEVLTKQPSNQDKTSKIRGTFIVHEAGTGKFAEAFSIFLNQTTTADEFLAEGRRLGDIFARMTYPIWSHAFRLLKDPE
jgi:hypothetical protein